MKDNKEKLLIQMLTTPQQRQKAFGIIVRQHSEQLYWKIRNIVLDHENANDVLQNTFLKAWNNIGEFRSEAKISTWLYRIAVNESLDFLRRQRAMPKSNADLSVANRLMADSYFDGDRAEALLREAVEQLPDVQRLVFNLKYFDNMKYSEISKMLGTSEGALKASFHIAVEKINDYVQKHS